MFRAAPAAAQGSVWIDGTTSTAQPPADVVDETSSAYALLGIRGELPRRNWKLGASASVGNGLSNEEGRWIWADAAATRSWFGARHSFVLGLNGFALHYAEPFTYSAYAAELSTAPTWRVGPVNLTLTPRGTVGFWQSDTIDGDIGVFGGSVQIARSIGQFTAALTAEAYDATNGALNGTYRGIGAEATLSFGSFELGGGVKRWENPVEPEWGHSAYLSKTIVPGVDFHVQLARSVTDPVLASPGSFGASIGVSWRILSGSRKGPVPVVRVGPARSPGRLVVFTVETAASAVSLSGSFSEWTPIPMRRNGRRFTVEVVVPPGTHQYGFLLDGDDWFVPSNAFGIVDDGFGRKNATLVVEQR